MVHIHQKGSKMTEKESDIEKRLEALERKVDELYRMLKEAQDRSIAAQKIVEEFTRQFKSS